MTRGQVFSFDEARRHKAHGDNPRWSGVADSFATDVLPAVQPSFRIGAGEVIFTIGSCFARNIERHLHAAGCRVPMLDFHLPPHECSKAANSAMNKFHPPAFRQCLEWTAAIRDRDGEVSWEDCAPLAFELGEGRLFDMDLGGTAPVARERFIERRQHIYDIFSQAFVADCLMMTPGLIEAWLDRTTGLYIHDPPTQKAMMSKSDRWEFEVLSYEQCLADLLAAIDVVRARNPEVKVLITTSPVPLSTTFSGQDVRVANAYSKSVLRAVCGAAAHQRPMTDYFPSYECATLSNPSRVWDTDRIHVASGFVGKIVNHMLDHYLEQGEQSARDLQQAMTALMNGAFAEAETMARAVLADRPGQIEARRVLAEALLRQLKCADAEAEFLAAVDAAPERADVRIGLARSIVRGDGARAPEALSHVEAASVLPTMGLSDFNGVAELIRRRAPPELAERLARRSAELFPLHMEAYELLIDVLVDQGRKPEAIEVLRHVRTLRRVRAPTLIRLAEQLFEHGEPLEARDVLSVVRGMEPGNQAAAALLARIEA
jgi:thioredoxin-like negative regulator of GroEL